MDMRHHLPDAFSKCVNVRDTPNSAKGSANGFRRSVRVTG